MHAESTAVTYSLQVTSLGARGLDTRRGFSTQPPTFRQKQRHQPQQNNKNDSSSSKLSASHLDFFFFFFFRKKIARAVGSPPQISLGVIVILQISMNLEIWPVKDQI